MNIKVRNKFIEINNSISDFFPTSVSFIQITIIHNSNLLLNKRSTIMIIIYSTGFRHYSKQTVTSSTLPTCTITQNDNFAFIFCMGIFPQVV